ncbi:MAG: hypothetical protein WC369_05435 [Dehalococcoidales bacterium]|jgi:hypothetical protein
MKGKREAIRIYILTGEIARYYTKIFESFPAIISYLAVMVKQFGFWQVLWAADASHFRMVGWGYYYLVTTMDDYSRYKREGAFDPLSNSSRRYRVLSG